MGIVNYDFQISGGRNKGIVDVVGDKIENGRLVIVEGAISRI